MQKVYVFDVDGTLTPARQMMLAEFAGLFEEFCDRFPVYLVSGSDYGKILEQVPSNIIPRIRGVFGCSGATLHRKGFEAYSKDHKFSMRLLEFCENFIDMSPYSERTGKHIEQRHGMINISVVGRNATLEQRKAYHEWDMHTGERVAFIERLTEVGLGYEATAGGEISIDIAPTGWNKSVVMNEILREMPGASIEFFGDRMQSGGNDLPLARALSAHAPHHNIHPVKDHFATAEILSKILQAEHSRAA